MAKLSGNKFIGKQWMTEEEQRNMTRTQSQSSRKKMRSTENSQPTDGRKSIADTWTTSRRSTSLTPHPLRGVLSAKVPNSSFAVAHRVLLSEPTHMEDEDEDEENEQEDERHCEECKVERRRDVRHTTTQAHEAWMT